MRLTSTLALRSLVVRPGRTLFSVLGIAVGIATVVGVFTLDHNTIEGLRRQRGGEWKPDLEVRAGDAVDDPARTLGQVVGVAGVAAFFQNEVRIAPLAGAAAGPETKDEGRPGAPGGGRQAAFFAAEAEALAALDAFALTDGRPIRPRAEGPEALLGAELAGRLGVAVGDAVRLSPPPRRARRDCVDGELRVVDAAGPEGERTIAFEVVGLLAPEKLGRRAGGDVVLADYEWGRELFRGARVEPRYWVRRDPTVDIERVQAGLGSNFAYDVGLSVLVGQAADERAFRNGVRMAGLLALVLGLYVIFHTLSMSLVERVREVSLLQALGATRWQTARVFLTEAAVLAGGGGLLGLLGGLALARLLLARGITTLGADHDLGHVSVPWRTALVLTGLGVAVALLGSVYPLLRTRAVRASAGLRGEQALEEAQRSSRGFHLFATLLLAGLLPAVYFVVAPVVGETSGPLVGAVLLAVGLLALLVAVPLLVPSLVAGVAVLLARPFRRRWPFAGTMAVHSMRDSRHRIAVSTSALALVVAATVGLKGMVQSLHAEVDAWAGEALHGKVFLENLPDQDHDRLVPRLAALPGVAGVEWNAARTFAPFLLVGLRVEDLPGRGPAADPALRRALTEQNGVVLSRRVAENLGYEVGDRIQASSSRGGVREFRVVAVSDALGYFPNPDERMYGVVSDRLLERYYCLDSERPDRVALVLDEGADEDALLAALDEEFHVDVRTTTGAWIRDWHARDIDTDFFLFDVILLLTAVLAALGVLNGQLLSALERGKEHGVLKAIGTTHRQVAGMVALESAVIGAIGGTLGVVLGSALGPVIVRSLEELADLHLPPRTAGPWLLLAWLGAVLVALLAGAYPIWRMGRVDAVRAVRTG